MRCARSEGIGRTLVENGIRSARRQSPPRLRDQFLDITIPHAELLYNVALRVVGDAHLAEDLVQETYLAAFRSFDGYRGGSARSWLVSICLNTARSQDRRRRSRPIERYDIDLTAASALHDTCDAALVALERDRVRAAVDALPEAQRVSVILCDLAGLTAQEAADALGCPRGTVLARVHRARRRLALELSGERHM